MPVTRRTAHADAVLSALGYRPEKAAVKRAALPALAALLGVGLLAAWFLLPRADVLRFAGRLTPKPNPRVLNAPAAAPKSNPPVAAAPAPKSNPPVVAAPAPNPPAPSIVENRAAVIENLEPKAGRTRNERRATIPEPRTEASNPPAASPAPKSVETPAVPDEFQLALYYQRSGDFEQALMHYRAALQRDEMNVEAHNNLGNLYLGKGLVEEAAREFQRVIAIDPKYLNAHVNLSAAYTRLGRPDAAAAEARAALQIDGRNPDAMVNLSLAQHDAGQTADAQRSLRRALEIDPHNAAAHYNMGRQFEAAGELSSAIAHYNQFIQYASPEQTGVAADVRARVAALAARLK